MRPKTALLATILLAHTATHATAADPVVVLPDTVVTATRVPRPVTSIPAGVTVLDRQAIEATGAVTLADVLATVPGMRVAPSGGPGGQASVFMRGTNSSHVLVLRDGMPLNDPSEASGAFNFGVDTLSDIERIEVVRGPMAALYGSGAIGGVINLISRRGTEGAPRLELNLAGGYPATILGSAIASGVAGPVDYAVTLESQSRQGFDSTPRRQSVYSGRPQGFRDRIATVNLGYTPVEGTRLSLFLRGRQTLFGLNSLGNPTHDTANSSGQTASLMGRLGVTSRLFGGTWETGAFLGRTQDNRRYLQVLDPADPNQTAQDNRYHAYRTDFQWNNTVHLNDLFASEYATATDLTFGYQHIVDTINVKVNDSFGGFPFTQAARATMITDAVHAGLSTTLWRHLTVTGQVRQDWVGVNSPTTWRLGAVLEVPPLRTSFKAAYGTAFRAPSLFQRFGVDSGGTIGNPALRPERSEGWEIGFITKVPVLSREDGITFGATLFNQQVTDLIVGVFTPVSTSVNVGSARIQGIEAEIAVRPAPWLILRGAYTFTDATAVGQSAATGSALLRRPRHAGSIDATLTPIPGLRIVSQLIYTGPSHDFLYGNNGSGTGFGVGQQGLIANLSAAYEITPKIQIRLDGTNIFNSRYEPVNGYQMPGTTVLAGIRVRI